MGSLEIRRPSQLNPLQLPFAFGLIFERSPALVHPSPHGKHAQEQQRDAKDLLVRQRRDGDQRKQRIEAHRDRESVLYAQTTQNLVDRGGFEPP